MQGITESLKHLSDKLAIFKTGNGESEDGESLKAGIFKTGNL